VLAQQAQVGDGVAIGLQRIDQHATRPGPIGDVELQDADEFAPVRGRFPLLARFAPERAFERGVKESPARLGSPRSGRARR
jgi:hypothetical protein